MGGRGKPSNARILESPHCATSPLVRVFLSAGLNSTIGTRGFFDPSEDAISIAEREQEKEEQDADNDGEDADANDPVDHNKVVVITATASAVGGVLATLLVVLVLVVVLKRRRRRGAEEGGDKDIRKVEDNGVYGIYYSIDGNRIDQSIMEVRDSNDYYGCDD